MHGLEKQSNLDLARVSATKHRFFRPSSLQLKKNLCGHGGRGIFLFFKKSIFRSLSPPELYRWPGPGMQGRDEERYRGTISNFFRLLPFFPPRDPSGRNWILFFRILPPPPLSHTTERPNFMTRRKEKEEESQFPIPCPPFLPLLQWKIEFEAPKRCMGLRTYQKRRNVLCEITLWLWDILKKTATDLFNNFSALPIKI